MIGLRERARRLREKMARAPDLCPNEAGWSDPNVAATVAALWQREIAGQSTSLRQVHLLAHIEQPAALGALRELEWQGMVAIEDDIHDALESRISVTDPMRARMQAGTAKDPA